MLLRILIALFLLTKSVIAGTLPLLGAGGPPPAVGDTPFTALHTYFIASNGNDACDGTSSAIGSSGHCAWLSPQHNVVCGDVIVAAAGSYTAAQFAQNGFGTVSSCPSTSGGIDGAGGIYVAVVLCGASDLEGCAFSGNSGTCGAGFCPLITVDQSNWAVEGFKVTPTGARRSFEANACASGTTILHHIAFINDVSVDSAQGFDENECAINQNVPGNGVDYFAVIGSIAQNSSQDGICLAAIDMVGTANFDNGAGTHNFIAGNFAWANTNAGCVSSFDSEAFMADTFDAHGYTGKTVFSNNLAYTSTRYCFQVFYQKVHVTTPTINIYNNTCYANLADTGSDTADGEFNLIGGAPWIVTVTNNIALTSGAISPGGTNPIYALIIGGQTGSLIWTNTTIGGTGSENIFKRGGSGNCNNPSTCDAGNNVGEFNGNSFGTNIYTDPLFTNTSDLISNRNGAPSCTGFENVTQCMGWNASTSTLTTPSIISDLTASCASCSGKGYQRPSTTCTSNADFPTWLKALVYLHWTGSGIVQKHSLATTPCGL